jgi:hypothetical protein
MVVMMTRDEGLAEALCLRVCDAKATCAWNAQVTKGIGALTRYSKLIDAVMIKLVRLSVQFGAAAARGPRKVGAVAT